MSGHCPGDSVALPSYEEVAGNPEAYNLAFKMAAEQANPFKGRTLCQPHGDRMLVVNPPALPLEEAQLDRIYALPFTRRPHPQYREPIPAYEQIRFSITSHRGCCGGCAFCAITHHQGKTIQSRSEQSVLDELDRLSRHPEFRGTITDVGGPTANMYGLRCSDPQAQAACRRESCLYPQICRHLDTRDERAVAMLGKLRSHPAVKHLFVASGIRFDLLNRQPNYFTDLLKYHVGGLLKVAPESSSPKVTKVMRKPGPLVFKQFLQHFREQSLRLRKKQAVVPYFISAHPGSTLKDMIDVAIFLQENNLRVEQVQEFTPTPGSLATCIYHTGRDPFTGETVHVPRQPDERRLQKALLLWHLPESRGDLITALKQCHREDLIGRLTGQQNRPTMKSGKPHRRQTERTRKK